MTNPTIQRIRAQPPSQNAERRAPARQVARRLTQPERGSPLLSLHQTVFTLVGRVLTLPPERRSPTRHEQGNLLNTPDRRSALQSRRNFADSVRRPPMLALSNFYS